MPEPVPHNVDAASCGEGGGVPEPVSHCVDAVDCGAGGDVPEPVPHHLGDPQPPGCHAGLCHSATGRATDNKS